MRTLIELLQPAGPALARRWLAALLHIDRAQRGAVVEEFERRVGIVPNADRLDIVHPPVQRDGYVEQVTTTYAIDTPRTSKNPSASAPPTRIRARNRAR
ncbi:hypothetical protein PHYC_00474 [Phycisphaerales bacterium]|nr:hypothetical protein PHYC_00474 [Phycisphaerales bacterium]